jgi:hypothetical protein
MREEEDGGGGVEQTVYPATVIYSASGNLHQISVIHDEVEKTELIQPSTCQTRSRHGVHYAR